MKCVLVFLSVLIAVPHAVMAQPVGMDSKGIAPVVADGHAATIIICDEDAPVVKTVAELLAGDIELVTGQKPLVKCLKSTLRLNPWAKRKMDRERGNIGPNTYAKVMELLLRLRANLLWPAMHSCSEAFWANKDNLSVARRYDIVLGSSHLMSNTKCR